MTNDPSISTHGSLHAFGTLGYTTPVPQAAAPAGQAQRYGTTVFQHLPASGQPANGGAFSADLPPPMLQDTACLDDLQDLECLQDLQDLEAAQGLAGVATATPCAPAGQWPAGSLIAEVEVFLNGLAQRDPTCSYALKTRRVMDAFGLPQKTVQCLLTVFKRKSTALAPVQALCWNVTQPTPLVLAKSGSLPMDALNALAAYQHSKAGATGERPIPAPTDADVQTFTKGLRDFFRSWATVFWSSVDLKKSKIGAHTIAIDKALEAYGAFQNLGVFMPVSLLLRRDVDYAEYNQDLICTFNNNGNYYVSEDGGNIGVDSRVAARDVVLTHAQIEAIMMDAMRSSRDIKVFDASFFRYLGYSPTYIWRRLDTLCRRGDLIRVDKVYSLAEPAAQDMHQAAPTSQPASKAPMPFGTADREPPAKKSRGDAFPPHTSGHTGAGLQGMRA